MKWLIRLYASPNVSSTERFIALLVPGSGKAGITFRSFSAEAKLQYYKADKQRGKTYCHINLKGKHSQLEPNY